MSKGLGISWGRRSLAFQIWEKPSVADKHIINPDPEERRNTIQSLNHENSAGNAGVSKVPASFQGDHLVSVSLVHYLYKIFYQW